MLLLIPPLTTISLHSTLFLVWQGLYYKSESMSHPFRSIVRLGLVVDILKAPLHSGGAGLKLDTMKIDKEIAAFFPKHS